MSNKLDNYIKYRNKFYNKIQNSLKKERYEDTFTLISSCSRMMYEWNQEYTSDLLEKAIESSSHLICNWKQEKFKEDVIVVYDAFGLDNRGLMQIYLNALCKIKRTVYITYSENENRIPKIKEILKKNNAEIEYINSNFNYTKQIQQFWKILNTYKAKAAFLYTTPWDVVGISVFNHLENLCDRYQINLTDHAFWLGVNAFDKCIEFRDYGAYISNSFRKIPKEKIVKIPFYPQINEEIEFEGYPFKDESKKVMFSGGAIYKTVGDNGKFYSMVRNILKQNDNVVFWYASNDTVDELDNLLKDFPHRVYHTKERKDLYQIYQHCDIFLNTYPITGGLMLQYSAITGVVPFTLKYDDEATGLISNEVEKFFLYDTEEELCAAVKKALTDKDFYGQIKQKLRNAVITPDEFENRLKQLVNNNLLGNEIDYKCVDVEQYRLNYLKRNSYWTYVLGFISKKDIRNIRYFPLEIVNGLVYKIIKKLQKRRKNAGN